MKSFKMSVTAVALAALLVSTPVISRAESYLTRSEVSGRVVKLFGVRATTNLSSYKDAIPGTEDYKNMSKAVAMKILFGSDDMKLRPKAAMTFEELCTVLGRAMRVELNPKAALPNYSYEKEISPYARAYVAAVLNSESSDKSLLKVKPGDFVDDAIYKKVLMAAAPNVIQHETDLTRLTEGSILVTVPVELKNINVKGNLVLANSLMESEVKLVDSSVSEKIVLRGGKLNLVNSTSRAFVDLTREKIEANQLPKTEYRGK